MRLAWRCKAYGVLPRAGGIDDQPAGLLDRMDYASFYYDATRLQSDLSAADFQARYPAHYKAWQDVMRHRRDGANV